jgi:hypothetical protein
VESLKKVVQTPENSFHDSANMVETWTKLPVFVFKSFDCKGSNTKPEIYIMKMNDKNRGDSGKNGKKQMDERQKVKLKIV